MGMPLRGTDVSRLPKVVTLRSHHDPGAWAGDRMGPRRFDETGFEPRKLPESLKAAATTMALANACPGCSMPGLAGFRYTSKIPGSGALLANAFT
jgi:hypothetical protein